MSVPIEHQLELEVFQRYLHANPDQTREIALKVFHDFLALRSSYATLHHQHQQAIKCLLVHAEADAAIRIFLQQSGCASTKRGIDIIRVQREKVGWDGVA